MADNKVQFTISGKDNSKQAFDSAEKNAQSFASNVKSIIAGVFTGEAIFEGAKMALGAVKDFFADSIKASADAQANFNLVSSALQNIGVNAKAMTPGVIDQIDQIANKTGQDKDAVEKVYAQLVRSTGNYKDALKLLPTVIGVSITAHQDLTSAARVTAEAYHGNTRALRSMGIAAKDGQTAIQALSDNVRGAADAFGQSGAGQLEAFHNSLLALKESIGDVITKNTAFAGILHKVVEVFQSISKWIADNKAGITDFMDVVGGVIGYVLDGVIDTIKVVLHLVGNIWEDLKDPILNLAQGFLQVSVSINTVVIPAIEKLLSITAKLADKLHIHLFDGLADEFSKTADEMLAKQKAAIQEIEALRSGKHIGTEEETTTTPTATANVTGDNTLGKKTKQKHIHTADENKEFTEFLANLQKELDIQGLRANALAALTALQSQYNAVANDATKSVKERVDAEKHLQEITKIIDEDQRKADEAKKKAAEEQKKADQEAQKAFNDRLRDLHTELGFSDTQQKAQKELNDLAEKAYKTAHDTTLDLQARLQAQQDYNKLVKAGAKPLEEGLTLSQATKQATIDAADALAEAFGRSATNTKKAFENITKAVITSAKQSVAAYATYRAKQDEYEAGDAIAKAFLGDPNAAAAAALFLAQAAAWTALAAEMGGGGGGSGGGHGGGGGAGSARSNSGISSTQQLKNRTPGQIYIQGGLLNLNDPAQADAFQKALENFTGQNVQIIPR